jgi:hypothetical protein
LLPHEAAFVMQVPLRTVLRMMRRGELVDIGVDRCRRVDPAEIACMVDGRPLALEALNATLAGRLLVPRLALDTQPQTLIESWDELW